MKAQEIREKLEKAQEAVTKKQGTLQKYYAKAEKIRNQIIAKGWDIEAGRYQKHIDGSLKTKEAHECYWMFCDYDDALDGIERTKKAIAEKQETVAKWEFKLQEAEKKERVMETQFPEVLKDFQNHVIKMWDEWDAEHKKFLEKEYNKIRDEVGFRKAFNEFCRKYSYSDYELMTSKTMDEIHRDNVNASERLLINLWNRVKDIVGEATGWSGLYLTHGNEYEGVTVNGIVIGTAGAAKVETISAGGWNIQKYHYRTLVHAYR